MTGSNQQFVIAAPCLGEPFFSRTGPSGQQRGLIAMRILLSINMLYRAGLIVFALGVSAGILISHGF
jgi:hypothetical protein